MSDLLKTNENPFDPKNVSLETARFNEDIEKVLVEFPPFYLSTPKQIRDDIETGKIPWPVKRLSNVEERIIPGPSGDIPIRVYMPENVNGVYMDIHGGGFALGQAYHSDERMVELANKSDVATVSVEYRLAPENPFPAGLEDCETVADWLLKNAKKEFGSEKLIVGGDSAGANLSVATLIRLRNKYNSTGFSGTNLLYGMFDLTQTPSVRNWGEKNLFLTTKLCEWIQGHYVNSEKYDDPEVSPLYAELSNLPPALFTVGTLDPLLDDSLFMYMRWIAAGNKGQLGVYPGGIHHFDYFQNELEISRTANSKIGDFIRGLVNTSVEIKTECAHSG